MFLLTVHDCSRKTPGFNFRKETIPMNFQNLEYLIEISNCGSISAAAKRLFVTQPYLSKVLRETEKEYGLTIFTRGKNGIIPTESGRLFLDMSRDLIEHAKHFKTTFKEHSEAYRLRVSSSSCSHSSDAFIRMVNSLADTPFRFFYREMTGNEVIEDVYTNRADIGFIMYPAHKADKIQELLTFRHLEARPLFQSPTQFFCRVGHPILKELDNLTPEKLYQYNFVLYPSESTKTRAAESVYNDETLQLIHWNRISQVIYVNSRALLHNVIQRSDYLGIGLIPMREQVENYNIVSFPLPDWMRPEADRYGDFISAYIFQKGIQLPKAARAYITFLEQFYGPDSGYEEECSKNKSL